MIMNKCLYIILIIISCVILIDYVYFLKYKSSFLSQALEYKMIIILVIGLIIFKLKK